MQLTLEQQVAQRLILGFPGFQPTDWLNHFLHAGLGGVIFFRDNFQEGGIIQSPIEIANLLANISHSLPKAVPAPFLSIDQEGGQVERLPHPVFPATLTPMAIAKSRQAEALAQKVYASIAQHLALLGFNLNYAPTLDVNLQTANPIIGVRSFGEDPVTVWRLAQIALREHERHGILTVGKHFPGHGNGTVDSHQDLPTLDFTETELSPFRQAIQAGLPIMMVSHGFYPVLQITPEEQQLPASASPTVIQGLLRKKCHFQGLVMTDDMCMGAITQHRDPVEAALAALSAGADILIYKQSTETEWSILQAIVQALESGKLDRQQHKEALARILTTKQSLPFRFTPSEDLIQQAFQPEAIEALSATLAQEAVSVLAGDPKQLLPLSCEQSILLLHPDRKALHSYAWDQATSPELPVLFQQAGYHRIQSLPYVPGQPLVLPTGLAVPDVMVWITWNSNRDSCQLAAFQTLTRHFPTAKSILVSAGTPYGLEALSSHLHLGLFSYRPASMQALVNVLQSPHLLAE